MPRVPITCYVLPRGPCQKYQKVEPQENPSDKSKFPFLPRGPIEGQQGHTKFQYSTKECHTGMQTSLDDRNKLPEGQGRRKREFSYVQQKGWNNRMLGIKNHGTAFRGYHYRNKIMKRRTGTAR